MLSEPRKLERADVEHMEIPRALWNVKVEGCQPSVRQIASNYVKAFPEAWKNKYGLILAGPAGVGKTALAVILLKVARSWGLSGYFLSTTDLRDGMRNQTDFDAHTSVVRRARMVDVLVIDNLTDLDAQEKFWLSAKQLAEFVGARQDAGKLTFLTTSIQTGKDFVQAFPDLAVRTKGYLTFVPIKGDDMREKGAEKARDFIFGKGK